MVNLLLIASLGFNAYYFSQHHKHETVLPAESMDPYFYTGHPALQSVYNPDQTIFDRFARIKKAYEADKSSPDYTRYEADKTTIKKDWSRYCVQNLRRITNIESRLDQYAITLYYMGGGSPKEVPTETFPNDTEYDIVTADLALLNDIEHYYAQFISNETYKSIKQSTD